MTRMAIVDARLEPFVVAMREKLALPKNQAKGDWRRESIGWLIERLREEVRELEAALSPRACSCRDIDCPHLNIPHFEKARREAADVANVAMMIWDAAHVRTYVGEARDWTDHKGAGDTERERPT